MLESITNTSEVAKRSIASVKWTYLRQLLPRLVQPLVLLVLTRYLAPEDYGRMAIAIAIVMLLRGIADFGLSKALVQTEKDTPDVLSGALWLTLLSSLLAYGMLYVAAPHVAHFYDDAQLSDMLRWLGLSILITGASAVPTALLNRSLRFRALFYIGLGSSLCQALVSILMAWSGAGVWALVTGNIAATMTTALLSWSIAGWYPKANLGIGAVWGILPFAAWTTAETLAGWVYMFGDDLMVGYFMSARELGVYTVSYTVVVAILAAGLSPITNITFPAFSRLQDKPGEFKRRAIDVLKYASAISAPIGIGILVTGEQIADIAFSADWQTLAAPMMILGVVQALAFAVGPVPDTLRAFGQPDVIPKAQVIKLSYTIPLYYLGAQLSLILFCYTKLLVVLIGALIWLWIISRLLATSAASILKALAAPWVAAAAMGLTVFGLSRVIEMAHWPAVVEILLLISSGAVVYPIYLRFLDNELSRDLWHLFYLAAGIKRQAQ